MLTSTSFCTNRPFRMNQSVMFLRCHNKKHVCMKPRRPPMINAHAPRPPGWHQNCFETSPSKRATICIHFQKVNISRGQGSVYAITSFQKMKNVKLVRIFHLSDSDENAVDCEITCDFVKWQTWSSVGPRKEFSPGRAQVPTSRHLLSTLK